MFVKNTSRCPGCGNRGTLVKSGQQKTKFGLSKVLVASFVAGPFGLVIGACIGNKKSPIVVLNADSKTTGFCLLIS